MNERYGFNDKPTLIDNNKFDNLDDDFNYNKPEEMKKGQYAKVYRGWDKKEYYDNYINAESKDFKYGEGGTVDGVGTYATDNRWSAMEYSENDGLFMEIAIPSDAKFISIEDLNELHYGIYNKYNENRKMYEKKYGTKVTDILDTMNQNVSTTAVLNGYDIIYDNKYRNWVILNRKILKIKKK